MPATLGPVHSALEQPLRSDRLWLCSSRASVRWVLWCRCGQSTASTGARYHSEVGEWIPWDHWSILAHRRFWTRTLGSICKASRRVADYNAFRSHSQSSQKPLSWQSTVDQIYWIELLLNSHEKSKMLRLHDFVKSFIGWPKLASETKLWCRSWAMRRSSDSQMILSWICTLRCHAWERCLKCLVRRIPSTNIRQAHLLLLVFVVFVCICSDGTSSLYMTNVYIV